MQKLTNDYLKQLLTVFEPYTLSDDDQKNSSNNKAEFITQKLSRKKFRRRVLAPKTRQIIFDKVKLSIDENRPMHFTIPFGGYKHFWNPSHPEPDWAELFNFKYLTEYVSPVLAVHEPGVVIEYMSEEMILNRMNNYPKQALEQYSQVFAKILEWYKKHVPANLDFRFFRVGDRCDKEKILEKIEAILPERRATFEKLSQEDKDRELHRSFRSVLWNGDKDLTGLSEEEKYNRAVDSRLIELAYYETESLPENMGDFLGEDNHICICFSFGTTHDNDSYQDLTLGSTYGSVVDHWIGRGILEHRPQEVFYPRIISKNQYEAIKNQIENVEINGSCFSGLQNFKNYKSIDKVNFD